MGDQKRKTFSNDSLATYCFHDILKFFIEEGKCFRKAVLLNQVVYFRKVRFMTFGPPALR